MSLHRLTLTAIVELPDDDVKKDIYGTTDPAECIQIDFDNDPAMFLMEQADEMEIVEVAPL